MRCEDPHIGACLCVCVCVSGESTHEVRWGLAGDFWLVPLVRWYRSNAACTHAGHAAAGVAALLLLLGVAVFRVAPRDTRKAVARV